MAATHGVLIGWNRPIPGQEKASLETFQGFLGYLQGLVNDKKVDSFEPVLLLAHGGDLNGFVHIRADRNRINDMKASENWKTWATRGSFQMMNFGIIDTALGDEMQDQMKRWAKVISG